MFQDNSSLSLSTALLGSARTGSNPVMCEAFLCLLLHVSCYMKMATNTSKRAVVSLKSYVMCGLQDNSSLSLSTALLGSARTGSNPVMCEAFLCLLLHVSCYMKMATNTSKGAVVSLKSYVMCGLQERNPWLIWNSNPRHWRFEHVALIN